MCFADVSGKQFMGKILLMGGDFEAAHLKIAKAYEMTHDIVAASLLIECSMGRLFTQALFYSLMPSCHHQRCLFNFGAALWQGKVDWTRERDGFHAL